MAGVRVDIDQAAMNKLLAGKDGPVAEFILKKALQVERHAKATCPVDTGRLRGSITSVVVKEGDTIVGMVGTDVVYATFVEFGTARMSARPFLLPALASIMHHG